MIKEKQSQETNKKKFVAPINLAVLSKIAANASSMTIIGSGYSLIVENEKPLSDVIISTTRISELKKIFLGDHYLEIGSGVFVSDLLAATQQNLPEVLRLALLEIGIIGVRNSATIGGSLCMKHRRPDSFLPLCILDAEVEIRMLGSKRKKKPQKWIKVRALENNKNMISLGPGDLLTRVRIPMQVWDIQFFRKIGQKNSYRGKGLIFVAVGKLDKGTITEFKIMISNQNTSIRGKTPIESIFIGYPYPLSYQNLKETNSLVTQFCEGLPKGFSQLEQHAIKQMIFQAISGG